MPPKQQCAYRPVVSLFLVNIRPVRFTYDGNNHLERTPKAIDNTISDFKSRNTTTTQYALNTVQPANSINNSHTNAAFPGAANINLLLQQIQCTATITVHGQSARAILIPFQPESRRKPNLPDSKPCAGNKPHPGVLNVKAILRSQHQRNKNYHFQIL